MMSSSARVSRSGWERYKTELRTQTFALLEKLLSEENQKKKQHYHPPRTYEMVPPVNWPPLQQSFCPASAKFQQYCIAYLYSVQYPHVL